MSSAVGILVGDRSPDVREAVVPLLEAFDDFEINETVYGEAAIEATRGKAALKATRETTELGDPYPVGTSRVTRHSQAIFLGPVQSEEWAESDHRQTPIPETAIRTVQKALSVHAFIQPVTELEGLSELAPLRPENLKGTDLVVVHALGDFFEGAKGRSGDVNWDRGEHSEEQIRQLGRTGFDIARQRASETGVPGRVTSIDKANVMETSRQWRDAMEALQKDEYPDVELENMLADSAAMAMTKSPAQFDVIVSNNLFGNTEASFGAAILDERVTPSGWLNPEGRGIFRPATEKGLRNRVALSLLAAMALRYSLGMPQAAGNLERAISETLKAGAVPQDLGGEASPQEFTAELVEKLPKREA